MTSAFAVSLAPPQSHAPDNYHAAGPSRPGSAGRSNALSILAEPEPEQPGCRWCSCFAAEEEYPGGGRNSELSTRKVEMAIMAKFEANRLAREQEAARQARRNQR